MILGLMKIRSYVVRCNKISTYVIRSSRGVPYYLLKRLPHAALRISKPSSVTRAQFSKPQDHKSLEDIDPTDLWPMIALKFGEPRYRPPERDSSVRCICAARAAVASCVMKRILRNLRHKILFKELPPPYRENEDVHVHVHVEPPEIYDPNPIPPCEVLDLLANCTITKTDDPESDVEYAEIQDMGLWHSTPLSHRHKSKISLTWVLKENLENTKPQNDMRFQRQFEDRFKKTKMRETRVVGRNEYYHNLRFRSACEEFVSQETLSDETSATEEYVRKKHKHRHRRKKRNQERFGYDIRDLDSFLSEATIDRPGNIPVVIAYPTTLYQTQKELQRELTLPLGTVVNAVFKNQQWLYAQTPHGDEGYVIYSACLPLGILPNRTSPQKKTPCWESSTDIYPRPCGNLTDNEKEQLRTRTRSETRYKPRKQRCAEKDFDSLYLRTKSVCSNVDKINDKFRKPKRQTLLVVNSDYKGSVLNKTLSVREGDVVALVERGETDVDADWFYVRKRDGSQGFIPAAIAGHGYI